jgi:hypothetical protein
MIVSLISNGCTAIGYGVGYSVDMKQAPKQPVEDISDLKRGDHIRLTTIDQAVYNGVVKETGDADLTIGYRKTDSRTTGIFNQLTLTLNLNDIKHIEKRQPKTGGRKVFTTLGIACDIIIGLCLWTFHASASAAAATS